MSTSASWFFWAASSACFAALTAIFAKVGINGVDSDFATLLRTVVIVFVLAPFVWLASKWSNPLQLPPRSLLFLGLSALATGASWICYFRALQLGEASKVAPVDKFMARDGASQATLTRPITSSFLASSGVLIAVQPFGHSLISPTQECAS